MLATTTRKCQECNRRFRVDNQSRRSYCEECRPPRARAGTVLKFGNSTESTPAIPLGNVVKPGDGPIESVVRRELQEVGRDDCVPGALALRLARQLDVEATTGSQAAALSKRIQELVDAAKAGLMPDKDWLDDLAERRRAKVDAG